MAANQSVRNGEHTHVSEHFPDLSSVYGAKI